MFQEEVGGTGDFAVPDAEFWGTQDLGRRGIRGGREELELGR